MDVGVLPLSAVVRGASTQPPSVFLDGLTSAVEGAANMDAPHSLSLGRIHLHALCNNGLLTIWITVQRSEEGASYLREMNVSVHLV